MAYVVMACSIDPLLRRPRASTAIHARRCGSRLVAKPQRSSRHIYFPRRNAISPSIAARWGHPGPWIPCAALRLLVQRTPWSVPPLG